MMLAANMVGTSYAFCYPKSDLKSASDLTNNYTINDTDEVEVSSFCICPHHAGLPLTIQEEVTTI